MNSERIDDLLAEIDRIQAERRKNWPSPDGPNDEALEADHARRIQECRKKINRLSNATMQATTSAPCEPEKHKPTAR